MTDWQTSLMQRVADPSYADPVSRFAFPGANLQPDLPLLPWTRDRLPSSTIPSTAPAISVKHIGHAFQQSVDQLAVRELVHLLLRHESQQHIEAYLDAMLTRGFPPEHIYLRLLQPAARRLGELWLEDVCTFVDVTLATAVLQSGMRHLGPRFHQHGRPARAMRSIVLATLGGDQHTFGLAMTAEFFRRSGWTVFVVTSGDDGETVSRIRGERNVVVGFSVSRPDQIPALSGTMRRLRTSCRNHLAGIIVGGPLVATHPECARETEADAVGLDARQALAEAEALATGEYE